MAAGSFEALRQSDTSEKCKDKLGKLGVDVVVCLCGEHLKGEYGSLAVELGKRNIQFHVWASA